MKNKIPLCMKPLYYLLILLLIFGCKKAEKEINLTPLINKNYFSVAENNKKLDSITNIRRTDSVEIIKINSDIRYYKEYHMGGIHFLIEDSIKSYYIVNYLKKPILMCGNNPHLSKQDSVIIIKESIEKLQTAKPIKTNEIIGILQKYKNEILSKESNAPLQISFALKNDTIKGSTMHNILEYMEKNRMSFYDIRRMNIEELKIIN